MYEREGYTNKWTLKNSIIFFLYTFLGNLSGHSFVCAVLYLIEVRNHSTVKNFSRLSFFASHYIIFSPSLAISSLTAAAHNGFYYFSCSSLFSGHLLSVV
jgi:hypothetical protein